MTLVPSHPSAFAAGSLPTRGPAAGRAPGPSGPPRLASGIRLDGPMQGSGSRVTPHLVRRGDGQVVQVTPLLAAVLEAVDGERDLPQIAAEAGRICGRDLHPEDVELLIDTKARPLGLVRGTDGADPSVRRTDPLLGLRGRMRLVNAERTNAVVRPFVWLFRPAVVVAMTLAFAVISAWALLEHGMSQPVEEAMAQPALLLALIGLIVASAAFHEVGHAAACRYGGATPGVMGAAVYLVWPAFYTDVTDSYRLDRRGRLRVDLGGLYFNAVFTVAAAAAYLFTGAEALLILVPVQLLQMVRQLVPLVRFDGYHILADLIGVPDLFSRIKPTLLRALPWRRTDEPNPLRPWAQRVVVGWVVVVVPVLLVSFALLLANLPAVIGSALRSLRLQAELLGTNLDEGRIAAVALGVVAMATVAFVPLSTLYLGGRIFHRGSLKFWRATEGRPVPRAAAFAVAIALVVAAGPGLLPTPPTDQAGSEFAAPLHGGPGTEFALAGATPTEPDRARTPAAVPARFEKRARATSSSTGSVEAAPARQSQRVAPAKARGRVAATPETPATPPVTWPFSFPPPEPAGPGGNQVVVTNWTDGAVESALSASLEWDTDGVVDNENSAYALAACAGCRTIATAFQIVASTVPSDTVVPQNLAVAANEECERCATAAVAVQLVVTLDGVPDAEAKAELRDLVAGIQAREAAYASASPATIRAELRAAKAEAISILGPWVDNTVDDEADETDETDGTDGDPEFDEAGAEDPAPEDPAVEEPALEDPTLETPGSEDPANQPIQEPEGEAPPQDTGDTTDTPGTDGPGAGDPATSDPGSDDSNGSPPPSTSEPDPASGSEGTQSATTSEPPPEGTG